MHHRVANCEFHRRRLILGEYTSRCENFFVRLLHRSSFCQTRFVLWSIENLTNIEFSSIWSRSVFTSNKKVAWLRSLDVRVSYSRLLVSNHKRVKCGCVGCYGPRSSKKRKELYKLCASTQGEIDAQCHASMDVIMEIRDWKLLLYRSVHVMEIYKKISLLKQRNFQKMNILLLFDATFWSETLRYRYYPNRWMWN